MSFGSLEQILAAIASQPGWEKQQIYQRLLECWSQVVTPQALLHSRPVYISRQVLWVATSSAVWAQHLSLSRLSLLKKLTPLLGHEHLSDIRFSCGNWHNKSSTSTTQESSSNLAQHPSTIVVQEWDSNQDNPPHGDRQESVFQRWAAFRSSVSQHLPLCPLCQCPTPPGELDRWGVCAYCSHK